MQTDGLKIGCFKQIFDFRFQLHDLVIRFIWTKFLVMTETLASFMLRIARDFLVLK